jgi:hypothetical protein
MLALSSRYQPTAPFNMSTRPRRPRRANILKLDSVVAFKRCPVIVLPHPNLHGDSVGKRVARSINDIAKMLTIRADLAEGRDL